MKYVKLEDVRSVANCFLELDGELEDFMEWLNEKADIIDVKEEEK